MERLSIQKPQSGWTQRTRPAPTFFSTASMRAATSSAVSMWFTLMSITPTPRAIFVSMCFSASRSAFGPMREFEHEVVGVQRVEEIDQRLPVALLDRLAAVVAEAEMHGALRALVDRRRGRD